MPKGRRSKPLKSNMSDSIIQKPIQESHYLKAKKVYLDLAAFPTDPKIQSIAENLEIRNVITCNSADPNDEWIIAIINPLEEKAEYRQMDFAGDQLYIEGPAGIGKTTLLGKKFGTGDLQQIRDSQFAALTRMDLGTHRLRDFVRKISQQWVVDRSSWLSPAIYGGYIEKVIFLYGGHLRALFGACENILILENPKLSNEDLHQRVQRRGGMDAKMPLKYHTICRELFQIFAEHYGLMIKDINDFNSSIDFIAWYRSR